MDGYWTPKFGSKVTDPDVVNTPYIYLTGPWIYLVIMLIVGVIIINTTMCLCITCRKDEVLPMLKAKALSDQEDYSSDDERVEMKVYGKK